MLHYRYNSVHYAVFKGGVRKYITFADNIDGRFIATPFPPCCLNESDYFSTKVCDLGLHFGAKSSCPSNARFRLIEHWRVDLQGLSKLFPISGYVTATRLSTPRSTRSTTSLRGENAGESIYRVRS